LLARFSLPLDQLLADIAEFATKGVIKKSGPAMQMTEPDFAFAAWNQ
jgi:hypothetical protein